MTIYIDIIFLENVVMNYIILLTVGIVLKKKINNIRLLIGSIVGAVYTIFSYIYTFEKYNNIVLKILLSVVIIYIAFYPQTIKKMWKYILVFYLISFSFGGAAFALIYIVKPQDIIMKNGLFLGVYPFKMIVLGVMVVFGIVVVYIKLIRKKLKKEDMICDIEINIEGKKIKTNAMIDTGNLLKEPITNTPVVVVEKSLLNNIISDEILNQVDKILGGDFSNISEKTIKKYISKLKVIPYSSLGKQNGMLLGINVNNIKVTKDETENVFKNVIVGIYNKSLTKRGEYRALIGMDLL